MKRGLLALCLLLLLPLCASAVTQVPAGITQVEEEAFAGTGIDALILPASVRTVGSRVLAGCDAAYIYLQGAETLLAEDAAADVPFVFGPRDSLAAVHPGFFAAETLQVHGGLYYTVGEEAQPLCAQNPRRLTGGVTIPKLLGETPVTSLDHLDLSGAGVTLLRMPAYLMPPLEIPAEICEFYQTMTIATPVPDAAEVLRDSTVTWTTAPQGEYGEVSYLWHFTMNGETLEMTTHEPRASLELTAAGECIATVTAVDALGDRAVSTPGEPVRVLSPQPTWRALLIGNTYPGELNRLDGCDTDIAALRTVLGMMQSTDYHVTSRENLTASAMQSAIASAFAGAASQDVSLFYYSGHGNSDGSLVGTQRTRLSIQALRQALQNIPGTKIVILDCCYSGNAIGRAARGGQLPAEEGISAFNSAVMSAFAMMPLSQEDLASNEFVVMTACRGDQESQTVQDFFSGVSFGAFTYGLCYGSGYDEWKQKPLGTLPADTDGDGAITLGEAFGCTLERVAFLNTLMAGQLKQEAQYHGPLDFVLWRK